MDGGSESPNGNDDMSVHSVTSGGGCAGGAGIDAIQYTSSSSLKEHSSVACSPDEEVQWMDVQPLQQSSSQNSEDCAVADGQQQPMDTMMMAQQEPNMVRSWGWSLISIASGWLVWVQSSLISFGRGDLWSRQIQDESLDNEIDLITRDQSW